MVNVNIEETSQHNDRSQAYVCQPFIYVWGHVGLSAPSEDVIYGNGQVPIELGAVGPKHVECTWPPVYEGLVGDCSLALARAISKVTY